MGGGFTVSAACKCKSQIAVKSNSSGGDIEHGGQIVEPIKSRVKQRGALGLVNPISKLHTTERQHGGVCFGRHVLTLAPILTHAGAVPISTAGGEIL